MARTADLSASSGDWQETLQHLLETGIHPPQRTSLELNKVLKSVNTAPASLVDILDSKPVPHRERRELTRIVSRIMLNRMDHCKPLNGAVEKIAIYRHDVGEIDENERIRLNQVIKKTKLLFVSFSPVASLSFWWWDEDTKNRAEAKLSDAEFPYSLSYAFACDIFSELPDISDSRRKALQRDFRWAMIYVKQMDSLLDLVLEEIKAMRS